MLGSQTSVAKLTYQDYRQLPEDGRRYEIVDGELYMTPAPTTHHQEVVGELFLSLSRYVKERGLGRVFVAPLDVVLSEHTVVQPDIVFVSSTNVGIIKEEGIFGTPDLVVEVTSTSTGERDVGLKRRLYLRAGVREYWIVDPDEKSLTIVRPEGERRLAGGGAELRHSVLAGLRLDLDELFG